MLKTTFDDPCGRNVMKPHHRKKRHPTRLIGVRHYAAVASTGVLVILMSGQGQAHLKSLADSVFNPTSPTKVENQYQQGCHLLDEYSAIQLRHKHSHTQASDLVSLQSWLETARSRVSHPDHRNYKLDSNTTGCPPK